MGFSLDSYHGRDCSTTAPTAEQTERQSPAVLRPMPTTEVEMRPPAALRRVFETPHYRTSNQPVDVHGRILELENLVMTLMKGQPASSLATPPADVPYHSKGCGSQQDTAKSLADPGTLKVGETGTSYVQNVHWESVLSEIRGLKEDLVTDSKVLAGSHLFYGPNRRATREEILAAVPSRVVADRLMALHFESCIITPDLIHRGRFLREYESFWTDPSGSSIAWIGLMFSMLCIAALLQCFSIDSTGGQDQSLKTEYLNMKEAFREKAVQCLVLARYTTGGPYILETLITILAGEFVLLKDGATDSWLSIGLILQIAIRMGYHRDPDHFPGLSPFESEMRRRIWTAILQLDLITSLEAGLPRNATDAHIDTKPPSNLLDSDFDQDTHEMPPSRPETEWTPILPLITRRRLIFTLGKICDINSDIKAPSQVEVAQVDAILQDVYKHAIPPVLRWTTMPHPITDSPAVVAQRIWREASSASVEAGKVAKALSIVLGMSEVSANPGKPHNETDLEAMFGSMQSDDMGGTYNQYFPTGFYSPLTFFDNVFTSRKENERIKRETPILIKRLSIDAAVAEFNLRQEKFLRQVRKEIRSLVKNTSKTECLSVIATGPSGAPKLHKPWGRAWQRRFWAVRKHKSENPSEPSFPVYDGETLDSPLSTPIQNKVQDVYRQFYRQNSDIVDGLIAHHLYRHPDVQEAVTIHIAAAIRSSVAPVSKEIYDNIARHIVQALTGEVPTAAAGLAGDATASMTTDIALSVIAGAMVHAFHSVLNTFVFKTVATTTMHTAGTSLTYIVAKAVMAGLVTTASTHAAAHGSAATFTCGAYLAMLPLVLGIVAYQVYRFPSKLGKKIAAQVCNNLRGEYEATNRRRLSALLVEALKDGGKDIWDAMLNDSRVKSELEIFMRGLMNEKSAVDTREIIGQGGR
ncbi:putative transcriptional regulatory protein [Cyphellophora attinorum]|uniref:Putative transcriptional regulatory protein n=1 Tax=Cyphellophora attinorum TaxID=1664694 RepID=A0A0N1HC49_9EURO|nr:putative transcriptional regulatory protein [Phialophora attinorum]KPI41795.1 putative transcriptional regulatory protein [Phialophora attinorum]